MILEYGVSAAVNNGNMLSQTITVPTIGGNTGFAAVQTYTYDELNRLKSATENVTPHGGSQSQSWKQTYTFDRFGNRRFDFTGNNTTSPASNCTEAICNPTVSTTNNRLTSTGYLYDDAGNTTRDAEYRTFTYDGENKQTLVKNSSDATIGEYFYDGDGKRVKKVVPSTGETTVFVYDAADKQIAEYSTIVQSQANAKVAYLTTDHLGSPRINTDVTGSVIARHDYHPFGEQVLAGRMVHHEYSLDGVRKKFNGYDRDDESNLDYLGARYYFVGIGRFGGADPLMVSAETANGQSWNRYSFALNCPIVLKDIGGLYTFGRSVSKEEKEKFRKWHQGIKDALENYKTDSKKNAKQINRLQRVLDALGEEGKMGKAKVDVKINFSESILSEGRSANARAFADYSIVGNKLKGVGYNIEFSRENIGNVDASTLAHETQHVLDEKAFLDNAWFRNGQIGVPKQFDLVRWDVEDRGLETGQMVSAGLGVDDSSHGQSSLYKAAWASADEATLNSNMEKSRHMYLYEGYGFIRGLNDGVRAEQPYSLRYNLAREKGGKK